MCFRFKALRPQRYMSNVSLAFDGSEFSDCSQARHHNIRIVARPFGRRAMNPMCRGGQTQKLETFIIDRFQVSGVSAMFKLFVQQKQPSCPTYCMNSRERGNLVGTHGVFR
jgi:hypothetical protein